MAVTTTAGRTTVNASAGHLSVHIPGEHPDEISFAFERKPARLSASVALSVALDVGVIVLLVVLSRLTPPTSDTMAALVPPPSDRIVWLAEPGPGGGGGGGGNKMPDPPRKAELPGKDKISVPVVKPPKLEVPKEPPKDEPPPIQDLNIPAITQGASAEFLAGLVESTPMPASLSQGSGSGGGAGTGTGTGVGPGSGSGLGPGSGGGVGGGPYRPGNGVTTPVPIAEVKPQYTSEAMRARIQGQVWVECVVQPNGLCTNVQVVRSLDQTFGLDREAVRAAEKWRFRPGTRLGQPVPVLVTIELSFALR
jgi:TonB family protein